MQPVKPMSAAGERRLTRRLKLMAPLVLTATKRVHMTSLPKRLKGGQPGKRGPYQR